MCVGGNGYNSQKMQILKAGYSLQIEAESLHFNHKYLGLAVWLDGGKTQKRL